MEKSYQVDWNITPSCRSHAKTWFVEKRELITKIAGLLPGTAFEIVVYGNSLSSRVERFTFSRLENVTITEIYSYISPLWPGRWLTEILASKLNWIWNDVRYGDACLIARSCIQMGSACTRTHRTSENSKYSVQKRVDDSYPGKFNFRVSCSFYKTCQSNGSRRSQFVYKYMKNVLCLKRIRALQLPSQFLFIHWFLFAKISVLRFQETRKDPQSLIALKGSVFKLFLTPKVALDM